jgi:tetratricopeptide (TPR) repeat protein
MDSASPDAQVALGTVLFLSEWDWTAAERSLQRALEINPDHTESLLQYGSLQEALGRLDDGLRCKQQALARDPRSPGVLVQIAISYWHQRKYDETLVWARRALEADPKHVLACQFINKVYLKIGDVNRFAAWTVSQAMAWGFPEERLAVLKQVTAEMLEVYATSGLSGVRRFLVDQITNPQLDFDVLLKLAFFRAVLYGAAGRLDEAFDCLDQAIASRDPALVHLAVAPEWDSMRGDPRFAERLRSMALPSSDHDNIGN